MLAHIKREGDILNKVWCNSDFVKVSRAGGQKGVSKANSYEQGTSLMCYRKFCLYLGQHPGITQARAPSHCLEKLSSVVISHSLHGHHY